MLEVAFFCFSINACSHNLCSAARKRLQEECAVWSSDWHTICLEEISPTLAGFSPKHHVTHQLRNQVVQHPQMLNQEIPPSVTVLRNKHCHLLHYLIHWCKKALFGQITIVDTLIPRGRSLCRQAVSHLKCFLMLRVGNWTVLHLQMLD